MTDFGVFSDTDESVTVEDLLSQAEDLCILEQISKINTAASSCSLLPTHLETRFRNLKSKSLPNPQTQNPTTAVAPAAAKIHDKTDPISFSVSDPHGKLGVEKEPPPTGCVSSPSDSWNSSILSPGEGGRSDRKMRGLKKKKQQSYGSSPSESDSESNFSKKKPEKSRGFGWFGCLPKRGSKKSERKESARFDWVGKDDEFLGAGLGSSFSRKEQQKILRKAMKEEEKISREAEKIVKWAKQASARMSLHGVELDDELNDDYPNPK